MKKIAKCFAIALAMTLLLSGLTACSGDKADSPSSSPAAPAQTTTPTQVPQDNTPEESMAPEEPSTGTSSGNNGFPLYDNAHFLEPNGYDLENPTFTAISGKKIDKDSVELTGKHKLDGETEVRITFGKDTTPNDQSNLLREGRAEKMLQPGELAYFDGAWLYNPTDSELAYADSTIVYYASEYGMNGIMTIDGADAQSLTIEGLAGVLGTPTAAYGASVYEEVDTGLFAGEAHVVYVWLFNDFLIALESDGGVEPLGDLYNNGPIGNNLHCYYMMDGLEEAIAAATDGNITSNTVGPDSINALRELGLY